MDSPWSLLQCADLTKNEIESFFEVARILRPAVERGESKNFLSGKTVVNLFFENSTRTRLSFETAARRLGAGVSTFSASGSSVEKGETLSDTARNIEALGAQCLIVRHASAGSPRFLTERVRVPVINAGDGFHEHPTQGLLDAFTMVEKLGVLNKKAVLIIGDIAHSRVARSNVAVLKKLGARVFVCGPPTLLPPAVEDWGVQVSFNIEDFLEKADVVMPLRVQLERQNKMQVPSLSEYNQFWGINRERAKRLKSGAILLHPGPINRGVELDPEVADGSNAVILDQVSNGVLIRMAVLLRACAASEFDRLCTKSKKVHS